MQPTVLYRNDQATETRSKILRIAVDIASAEGLEGLSHRTPRYRAGDEQKFAHFGSKEQLQVVGIQALQ